MFLTDNEYILFSKYSWHDVARNQKAKLEEEVASMEGNRLLNTSGEDLCSYLIGKYWELCPILPKGLCQEVWVKGVVFSKLTSGGNFDVPPIYSTGSQRCN